MNKKYYGAQTEKAIKNFPFSFRKAPREFLLALVEIKKAAAIAHNKVGELDNARKTAIVKACDEILEGKHWEQFVLPAFQGGAGTSNHMNANEVIAARATEILQGNLSALRASPLKRGELPLVHPNDHVNMSHSTNDVMPSAFKIAAYRLAQKLLATTDVLALSLQKKSRDFSSIVKLGRTHLQDAVPITLGSEFASYEAYVRRGQQRIRKAMENLLELNLGGTAVGNSINASPKYIKQLYIELDKITKLPLKPAANFMPQTSSDSDFVWMSQALVAFCVDLSKISNDLRWLSAGPKGGLGEIMIPELQAGSSIMPGKVNPVLLEAVSQLYFLVSGNNLTIEHGAEGAQLELGVMLPIMTDRLIESLKLMDELILQFAKKCVDGIKADRARCKELLEKSTAYATLLSPKLGYDQASELVKEAVNSNKTIRELVLEKKLLNNKEFDAIIKLFHP
ncbi:MAG: aspartate ammonia-lyase [Candidatus Doudnabacteria bacterium]|nr:aspartate ammonia-lyase [Candidatus Doudnabacteria bacterium]